MASSSGLGESRRKFLRYLALSPALASPALLSGSLRDALSLYLYDDPLQKTDSGSESIASPEQALNVMEFEAVARKKLPPGHFAYLASGVDDDATVQLNHEAYQHIAIRSRRLIDVEKLDSSVELFGTTNLQPVAPRYATSKWPVVHRVTANDRRALATAAESRFAGTSVAARAAIR